MPVAAVIPSPDRYQLDKVFEIIAYTCKVEENGDFQILDLRTPFCTIDDIGGVPPSDAADHDPAS